MVTPGSCTRCGANLALVGQMHRCMPSHVTTPEPMPVHVANERVANKSMANKLANASAHPPGRNRASSTYRYRNPDKRRLYQRDLMRKRRATGRAA